MAADTVATTAATTTPAAKTTAEITAASVNSSTHRHLRCQPPSLPYRLIHQLRNHLYGPRDGDGWQPGRTRAQMQSPSTRPDYRCRRRSTTVHRRLWSSARRPSLSLSLPTCPASELLAPTSFADANARTRVQVRLAMAKSFSDCARIGELLVRLSNQEALE